MTTLQTPYYLIDKSKLLRNMEKIAYLREKSGAKALLALKCFATWGCLTLCVNTWMARPLPHFMKLN